MRHTTVVLSLLALAACSDSDAPTDHVYARTTQLVQYGSCSDLESDLKAMTIHELYADIDRADWSYGFPEAGAAGGDSNGASSGGDSSGGRQEGVDYSGTNNQVDGVDEADFVKTDGYHIYTLNGNRLHIMGVPQFGQLTAESVTQIEGYPYQMLLDSTSNRAVVFSQIDVYDLPDGHPLKRLVGYTDNESSDWYWRVKQLSKITVLDVTDRTAPKLVRELYYEGWYQTARKVNDSIRVAGYATIDPAVIWGWWNVWDANHHDKDATKAWVRRRVNALQLSDFIPMIYVRTPDGHFTTNSLSDSSCRQFYRPSDSHARGITSIISFDLLHDNVTWDADHIVSNYSTVYSSTDTMVVAESAHDWWWYWWFQDDMDQLNVHAFDISTPGQTHYIGSGRVDGMVLDQFSLDETNGSIRVATTTNRYWRWWTSEQDQPKPENHVWTLARTGDHLGITGHLGGIAKGEVLQTSRFLGDKAYLVTFHYTDPLITVDLSDNTNPRVAGELQVPGFSTYLHPMDAGHLLSIGIDSTQSWRTNISMFDVSDFAHPQLAASLPVEAPHTWGWSQALYDHHAFQYWAPKQLLAIPQSTWDETSNTYRYLSTLVVINTDPATGLSIKGTIDHSAYYNADPNDYWQFVDIRRSIFMGDYIYAISDKAITAHRLSDLGKVAEQVLPGYQPGDWYWWW
jgi:uncharacterized secreted protein with C-terminal beta-propeller domain